MAVAGKKDPLKQQKDSLNFKNNAVQKLSRLEQAQKTIDSVDKYTAMNQRVMGYKSEMCSEAGLCDLGGQRKLANEIYKMGDLKSRAQSMSYRDKVGPNPYLPKNKKSKKK